MSYTKISSEKAVRTGIFLVLTIIIFLVFQAGVDTVYASDERPDATKPEILVSPQQQPGGESELPWLFAVYIITWGAFFGYAFMMSRRQREMRGEIEVLKRVLVERERQEAHAEQES